MTDSDFNVNQSFGFLIGKAARALGMRLQHNFKKHQVGIRVGHWAVLAQLWAEDGLAQQDISDRSGIEKPNISRFVNILEEENYVVRIPDQIDQRINRIFLTAKGKNLKEKAVREAVRTLEEGLAEIDDADINRCMEVFEKIINNLK